MSQIDAFRAANARSPVVQGTAIGKGGEGAHYVLQNGQIFTLTAEECGQVNVRWKGMTAALSPETDQ